MSQMRVIRLKDHIEIDPLVAIANINGGLFEYADDDEAKAKDAAKAKADEAKFKAAVAAAVKEALAEEGKEARPPAKREPESTSRKSAKDK